MADAARIQFEGFQEAVMPFLLERAYSKRRTEGEMRAMFDEVDLDRCGSSSTSDTWSLQEQVKGWRRFLLIGVLPPLPRSLLMP